MAWSHFRREKFIPRGGPDGGDGGRGGDVIFEVKSTLNTLSSFRQNQKFKADDGAKGGPSQMSGRAGKDLVIHVPPGTIIFDAETNAILGDLTHADQQLMVCKGGRGGRGNQHFATSRNQAPRTAEKGAPHEEKRLRLELKLIADIGLIGVPNAGKSTLLSVLTNAKPKIAPYPFTTLEPNLGVADIDVEHQRCAGRHPRLDRRRESQAQGWATISCATSNGRACLVHLLDGLSEDPIADYSQINTELSLFDPNLAKKPQIIALNKIDQPEVQERLVIWKRSSKNSTWSL